MVSGMTLRLSPAGKFAAIAFGLLLSAFSLNAASAFDKKAVTAGGSLVQPVQFGGRGDRFEEKYRDKEAEWLLLGKAKVGFLIDRDVIRVGRQEGRFDKLVFTVRGNDIEILDIKVVYGNGQTEDIRVRQRIREGERTRPIDVGGDKGRFIKEIQMLYRSRPDFRGQAQVAVYAREAGGGDREPTEGKRAACETYANIAVVQAEANDKYKCRLRGPEWSDNKRGHLGWCMTQKRDFMLDEIRYRQNELQKCFNNLGDYDDDRYDRGYRRRF